MFTNQKRLQIARSCESRWGVNCGEIVSIIFAWEIFLNNSILALVVRVSKCVFVGQ